MGEHIRRGATLERDVDVPGDMSDDGFVLGEHYCTECDSQVYLRARSREAAYVRLGCDCGAASLALRIADVVEGDLERNGIELWEKRDIPVEDYE